VKVSGPTTFTFTSNSSDACELDFDFELDTGAEVGVCGFPASNVTRQWELEGRFRFSALT
jgi:hypothetical protein